MSGDEYPDTFAGYSVRDFLPEPDDNRDPRMNPANDRPAPAVPPSHQLDRIEAIIREALRDISALPAESRWHSLGDEAYDALDWLVGIARAAQDVSAIHKTPNARWDFHPFMDTFVTAMDALAAALAATTTQEPT